MLKLNKEIGKNTQGLKCIDILHKDIIVGGVAESSTISGKWDLEYCTFHAPQVYWVGKQYL